jgi:hypothetical protein
MSDVDQTSDEGEQQVAPAGDEWWATLPSDLHGEAKRFKSPETLLRTAMSRKQELSSRPPKDALVVPDGDASDEDKAAYREKRGIPDGPDGYTFELGMTNDPEKPWELPQKPDDEMLDRFRAKAHELGLSHHQAQGVVADFQELMLARAQEQGASRQDSMQQQQEYLTKTFGENAQSEIAALEPLFKSIMAGGEEWVTDLFNLQSTPEGLGNNGLFLRFMAGIRKMTRADRFVDVEQNGQITASDERPNLGTLYPSMKNWQA